MYIPFLDTVHLDHVLHARSTANGNANIAAPAPSEPTTLPAVSDPAAPAFVNPVAPSYPSPDTSSVGQDPSTRDGFIAKDPSPQTPASDIKSTNVNIIIAVVVLVLLIVGSGVLFWYMNNNPQRWRKMMRRKSVDSGSSAESGASVNVVEVERGSQQRDVEKGRQAWVMSSGGRV